MSGPPTRWSPDSASLARRSASDPRAASAARLARGGYGSTAVQRLAELAARLLGTSSAQVSLIAELQSVIGGTGLAVQTVGTDGPAADSLCAATVTEGGPLVVEDALTDHRVAALPPVTSGKVRSYLGVPLTSADGHVVGALCVFDSSPRTWSTNEVDLLQQLAAPVVAELELGALGEDYEAGRVIWQLAVDAARIGAFDWDLTTGELRWDDRLLELFGLDRDQFSGKIEAFNELVQPDDLPRVSQALREAIESCGEFTTEYRALLPHGEVRWLGARGRALRGEDGTAVRLLGAAFDTTAVQEGEARVARVLEAMPTAFCHLGHDWRFRYVNAEAERLLRHSREELIGGTVWELFPAAVGTDVERHFRQAVATYQPVTFDAHYPAPLNGGYEIRVWPTPDGLSVYFLDVTARLEAQDRLDRAARRSGFLAQVTAELTETLDAEEAVARLAPLIVPELADWCVVTLVDSEGHTDWRRGLRDVGWWHADPQQRPLVDRFAEHRLRSLTASSFVAQALESAAPVVVSDHASEAVGAVLEPGEARDLFRRLDPRSGVFLPLRGRGRTVGLLTVYRGPLSDPFTDDDLTTLGEVAGRVGLALDNAKLFAEQRDLAEVLQRSLLTRPPEPDHLEVVVRYEPAAQAAQVGGDWYDAFRQRDGSTVVVIGDVVGHDTAAAADMGQVRSLLRGIAVHTGAGPAEVLRGVDQVMETLRVGTTATAVVARLERTGESGPQGTTEVRWSNAGHPPPLVIHPSGAVGLIGEPPGRVTVTPEADLLLGLSPQTPRAERVSPLERGSTLLLYTDGLVERRGQSLDEGLDRLVEVLTELSAASLPLEELCDRLLRRMLSDRPEDDVALAAVRLRTAG